MSELAASEPCSKCGASVFDDARYCSACGASLYNSDMKERAVVVREFAVGALQNADHTARDLLKNDTVKKIAGGAVLGLGVAAVVPFVSFAAGATLGAAYVGYKALTKN